MFIINLIPLHVFFLLLMGRFSFRIYVGKCVLHLNVRLISFDKQHPNRTKVHVIFILIQTVLQCVNLTGPCNTFQRIIACSGTTQ